MQQQYRYQKDKGDQINNLISQLLLLESRVKRKQKQISGILHNREITILRQQKIIETLSTKLVDHGLETIDPACTELDSLNDSDSAVVLEDIDSDCNSTFGVRRRSSGCGTLGNIDITVARSISDAIETNTNKYSVTRRSNCFLRRPEILETVYSVEEDQECSSHSGSFEMNAALAEKRDKFKIRSEKTVVNSMEKDDHEKEILVVPPKRQSLPCNSSQLQTPVIQVTNFNRVMSNHRSVTKPKDVKYKRINKAKSKSLEELRGRLKSWVERGTSGVNGVNGVNGAEAMRVPQEAQSYA